MALNTEQLEEVKLIIMRSSQTYYRDSTQLDVFINGTDAEKIAILRADYQEQKEESERNVIVKQKSLDYENIKLADLNGKLEDRS